MRIINRLLIVLLLINVSCGQNWEEKASGNLLTITNKGGSTLQYHKESGITLLEVDRFAFKDLNKNGIFDPYEDWRLSAHDRAVDLASKMTIDQIAGLMLYSQHQAIPASSQGYFAGTYGKKSFDESGASPSDLTDQQRLFLVDNNLRHVLMTRFQSPEIAAEWNNKAQALVEGIGLGIPVNTSSDPRHRSKADAEFNAGAGGDISMWPTTLGLAATFDVDLVENFGEIASKEYRALGITTALSPQIDLSTDPRWMRFNGTFGENPKLATDMARAYIDGFQNSTGDNEIADGWGFESVNTMVKHWPGGGTGEAGRDAHFGIGKYAVYPGNYFEKHLMPFIEGAFKLNGKTKMASAVMPYYTIAFNQDTKNNENVGNGYNSYIIKDLLRNKYNYDGVLCTDWLITGDETALDSFFSGKPWGVEHLSVAERHYKVLTAGVDQFGGNNDSGPVIEAYNMGVQEMGEEAMRSRFEVSAVRLLKNIIRPGLFENPYLDTSETATIVGNPEFMAAGYEAQLKSVVMLKNKENVLPLPEKSTVYIPKRFTPAGRSLLGAPITEKLDYPVKLEIVKKYFNISESPEEADFALVFIDNPKPGNGYDKSDVASNGTGYVPISLQYSDYTAVDARETSIAGGDPLEDFTNRSYKNKSIKTENIHDLNLVNETSSVMGGKPVIVCVNTNNPMIFSEIETKVDGILVHFGIQDQALLDIISGKSEPNGLLPFQMPANMKTVELQKEDVPQDMECHTDTEGNTYDFAYGMNWKGVIDDERTKEYKSQNR
ncbi:glycoside hydrolase family 3 protein [Maribacter sp. 4G9]|uniref:glycoside hydrolase family 3 protein n=1 Tax=Maribacter sp. 4G9 TaxID=1889777 RepID=UPI000C153BF2|nr:glycoside hydrolase family 3 N-terminal domain-containing protein [Maribacter sp. 4G9]PIB38286.1 beta-glucosidase [Maribacter sp. 4G9]